MSCNKGNCGGSCNSCHGCGVPQYSSNCYPIINVNCLPTIGRTTSHYIYRTPDDKLWYVNSACNAYLQLSVDKEEESNRLNVIIDLTNRIIELEKLLGVSNNKPVKTEFKSKTLTGSVGYVIEHNLETDTPVVIVKSESDGSVQIINPEIVVLDNNSIKLNNLNASANITVIVKK